jgi:hypothetical protein
MKRFPFLLALLMATAAQSQAADPPAADPPAPVSESDINTATSAVKDAWNDFNHCRRPSACNAYFDSFGVGISFGDGSIAPFSHVQRLNTTARDCIKNARAYLERGDKSMAVQWVMAARVEATGVRDWLGNHPDAVLEALRRCCS